MPILKSFGTHDGTFHADEVTACALLIHFNLIDEKKIFRSRDPKILDQCEYVCDVGGVYDPKAKRFDHHQLNYEGSLSSAGMILQYLKDQKVISPHTYIFLNDHLIKGVDEQDNGVHKQTKGTATFSDIIDLFNPIQRNSLPSEYDKNFKEALSLAKKCITKLLERESYYISCREIVKQVMENSTTCLIFDKNIPWIDSFFELGGENHPAKFIIMPTDKHWKLRGIPPTLDEKMKVRMPLPKQWAGLLEKDFKKKSKMPGAIFCHKGLFISIWETKEDALRALEYILNEEKAKS